MKNKIALFSALVITFIVINSCIDPHFPELHNEGKNLVVEALITNENRSYSVVLSRSYSNSNELEKISGATVIVSDTDGSAYYFSEVDNGIYQSDSTVFRGEAGKKYVLKIETPSGRKYRSDTCTMLQVTPIDSIYFDYDIGYTNNQQTELEGVSIFIDSEADDTKQSCRFYRWIYDECWIFRVPHAVAVKVLENNELKFMQPQREYCWKYDKSSEIMIHTTENYEHNEIKQKKLAFISPALSDRFSIKYSILVKQLSISQDEFLFWQNLRTNTETTGDIFDKQPFSIICNIHNVNDKNEKVLGYFMVSAVSQKRLFIEKKDILEYEIYDFHSNFENCEAHIVRGFDYKRMCDSTSHFGLVPYEPYIDGLPPTILGLKFSTQYCSDCSLSGDTIKPVFWVD